MIFTQCKFCHKNIFTPFFQSHKAKHTKLKPDGQMTDHITLPEATRYTGSLEGVPKSYRHQGKNGCGGGTGMPEEIIRSYLANPFIYNERSFCTGCGTYVSTKELFWIETGQSLFDYNKDLKDRHKANG